MVTYFIFLGKDNGIPNAYSSTKCWQRRLREIEGIVRPCFFFGEDLLIVIDVRVEVTAKVRTQLVVNGDSPEHAIL
jgi:hypothetical protein